ncbi:MAG: DUF1365 domain-containing protein [Kangiellaceae bacterium]|nr:DUF1365 domain-containing protein [Kangiellaceae bacterium]
MHKLLNPGFIIGTIRHNRYSPRPHLFTYNMYWSLLDLELVESNARKLKWLSYESWNLLSFRRKDFHHNGNKSNKASIQDFIQKNTGNNFKGKVYLLSHLRVFGFNFNSVCFYFCVNDDSELEYIVSEITNTPWGERHPYLHICQGNKKPSGCYVFHFEKKFHISPFVSMNMDYQWLFKLEQDHLRIHMKVNKQQSDKAANKNKVLDVTFTGKHLPLTQSIMNKMLLKHPFQPMKMVWRIYWQALKLWLKKTPFFSHPKYQQKT